MKFQIYDSVKERNVRFKDPYGKTAKRLYKQLIDMGTPPEMAIIPNNLKYYPSSKRFIKIKDPTSKIDYSGVPVKERSSFKKYMASYSIDNTKNIKGYQGMQLINGFRPKLQAMRALHGGLKFYVDVQCLMVKYLDGEEITRDTRWVASQLMQANNSGELEKKVGEAITRITEKIPELEAKNGSMWVFKQVMRIDMHVGRYKPLKGSSYVELPLALKNKYCIVNVKNEDNECFKWAVLSALYPVKKDACRVSKYKNIEHDLKFTQFPMLLSDIPKFENMNDISINVHGCDVRKEGLKGNDWLASKIGTPEQKKAIKATPRDEYVTTHVLQKSDQKKSKNIDLLLYEGHYSWIKNFSRFCGKTKTHGGECKTDYCHHCLQGYTSQAKLDYHLTMGCASVTTCKPCMPKKEEAFVEFKNVDKSVKAPFAIYADFECLTKPISKCAPNPNLSSTQAYQDHEPSGYTLYITGKTPVEYRGKDAVTHFIKTLKSVEKEILDEVHANRPMNQLTEAQWADFRDPCAMCHLCQKLCGEDRVRDHDHITGEYRGPAHSKCNLEEGKKNTRRYKVPVIFHNLKNYDGHLIIQNVGEHTSKIDVIPQNYEKYISFGFDHFKFLDSAALLAASLDTLASNLYDNGKGKSKFKHSLKYNDKEHIDLLLKKGVFP